MQNNITMFKEKLINEYVNFVSEDVNKILNDLMMDLRKTGRSFNRSLIVDLCRYTFKEEVITLTDKEIDCKLKFEFYNEGNLLENDYDFEYVESPLGMLKVRLKINIDRTYYCPTVASFNFELINTENDEISYHPITQEDADSLYASFYTDELK